MSPFLRLLTSSKVLEASGPGTRFKMAAAFLGFIRSNNSTSSSIVIPVAVLAPAAGCMTSRIFTSLRIRSARLSFFDLLISQFFVKKALKL